MKIKTSELIGTPLNWAIAQCENRIIVAELGGALLVNARDENGEELDEDLGFNYIYAPSANWLHAGPIMEREDISFRKYHNPDSPEHGTYYAMICRDSGSVVRWHKNRASQGPTPLIAAMRCYVASKLGNTVGIPDQYILTKE